MAATLSRLCIVAACAVMLGECSKGPPRPSKEELAKGQHLERPFTPPGRCFGKPSKCVSDAQCAPPFSLCQEGACCSGRLDPKTCECRCGDGPACGPRELCCEGVPRDSEGSTPGKRPAQGEERGSLQCRPIRECYGGE